MPDDHRLRIHIEYELLFLADLRGVVGDFERAYNILQAAETSRSRISWRDRLTVSVIETGKSVSLILLGGGALLALAEIIRKLAQTRETVWKSEETKWKAKTAKLEYEARANAADEHSKQKEVPPPVRAEEILRYRLEKVETSENIRSLQVEVDGRIVLRRVEYRMDGQRRIVSRRENLLPGEKKKEE